MLEDSRNRHLKRPSIGLGGTAGGGSMAIIEVSFLQVLFLIGLHPKTNHFIAQLNDYFWYMTCISGYKTISHGGDFTGYHTYVSVFPDMDIGVYTSMNMPDHGIERMFPHAYVLDIVLGEEPWFNASAVCDLIPSGKLDQRSTFWDLQPALTRSHKREDTKVFRKYTLLRPLGIL